MGDDHPFGPGGGVGALQAGPVGMVAQREATVHALASARAAQLHPAAGEAVAEIPQLAGPGAGMHRRWRHHQRATQGLGAAAAIGQVGQRAGVGQGHAGGAVGGVDRQHGAVHEDRADAGIHPRQHPLGLAEAVGHQQAGPANGGVAPPPGIHLGQHGGLGLPAVDRQAKGGFGDEAVAAQRLEGWAGGVGLVVGAEVVVARGHPHPAGVFQPHLGRAQHMAGGVQADAHAVVHHHLAIGQALQVQPRAQPAAQHTGADGSGQHLAVAGAGMVGMGMGDHRPRHRAPGVDVEVAGCAVQAGRAQGDQVVHGPAMLPAAAAAATGTGDTAQATDGCPCLHAPLFPGSS